MSQSCGDELEMGHYSKPVHSLLIYRRIPRDEIKLFAMRQSMYVTIRALKPCALTKLGVLHRLLFIKPTPQDLRTLIFLHTEQGVRNI